MSARPDIAATRDGFLGGRLSLWQPKAGYRAGVDPVILAAAVPARAGQSVLDLGCGVGAAVLSLGARVGGLDLTGIEIQHDYAALARRNAAENGIALDVAEADIGALPDRVRQRQFDHVIANPPYYREGSFSAPVDPGRGLALGERTPLADWVDIAARRLAPGGYLHVIIRTERMPDLLIAATDCLGSPEILPIAARIARAPDLILFRARKSGKSPFRLHAPLIFHRGERHDRDGESYVPEIGAVLRDAAPLVWPRS